MADATTLAAGMGVAGGGNGQHLPVAIDVAGLTKSYGEIEAVRGIDFTVPVSQKAR